MSTYYWRPKVSGYDRDKALEYAHKWAFARNPAYFDFENYGGDCSNFISQIIYAGCGLMNYSNTLGWYYIDSNHRSPAWTGVDFLYDFLINNRGPGPFGELAEIKDVEPGDLIQLSFSGGNHFNHTVLVVDTGKSAAIENLLTASHTDNTDNYPLTEYNWIDLRAIHILGARAYAGK